MSKVETRQGGFTLVELIVVMAIIGILTSIGTFYFGRYQSKVAVEKEATTIYSTLMTARLDALHTKTGRLLTLSGKQFNIYSTATQTATPITTVPLAYPVAVSMSPGKIIFDPSGMLVATDGTPLGTTAASNIYICVDPTGNLGDNPANTDSVGVSIIKSYLAKRTSGGACAASAVNQQ